MPDESIHFAYGFSGVSGAPVTRYLKVTRRGFPAETFPGDKNRQEPLLPTQVPTGIAPASARGASSFAGRRSVARAGTTEVGQLSRTRSKCCRNSDGERTGKGVIPARSSNAR